MELGWEIGEREWGRNGQQREQQWRMVLERVLGGLESDGSLLVMSWRVVLVDGLENDSG